MMAARHTPVYFSKFESTGNDFILIDGRNEAFSLQPDEIAKICHRRFGIGADGLIVLESHPDLDFRMRYYNSDGHEASFCGNGGRAICGFAMSLGIPGDRFHFAAYDGIHDATISKAGASSWDVSLGMNDVTANSGTFIDTGSPHHLAYVEDVDSFDVAVEGAKIRNSSRYSPGGCNVNFIEVQGQVLKVRTFERGVEEETLSCGTGVTASAIFHHLGMEDGEYTTVIRTRGGELRVSFRKVGNHFTAIRLKGETRQVFAGDYYL
jgi:diaminopimelate epimerase